MNTNTFTKKICSNIKIIRDEKRIKQEQMASYLGITQSKYNKIENGNQKLDLEILFEISKVFEMSVTDIIEYNKRAEKTPNKEMNDNKNEVLLNLKILDELLDIDKNKELINLLLKIVTIQKNDLKRIDDNSKKNR